MTLPFAPFVPLATASLIPAMHPELSSTLIHFCGRPRAAGPGVPAAVRAMHPADRLASILHDERLGTFVTYSGGLPATCFSEAGTQGLKYMIRERGYAPWGLMFSRQDVYNAGGAPAWQVRKEQLDLLPPDPRLLAWAVRLEAGSSDWLEEREWRIVREGGVSLHELRPLALIVGDRSWTGAQWRQAPGMPPALTMSRMAGGLPWLYWSPVRDEFEFLRGPAAPVPVALGGQLGAAPAMS